MSDNRKVAVDLLQEAAKTIAVKRPGIHGSAENSFEMIADFWTVYLRHAKRVRGNDTIRPEDVAEMMTMLKKARKVYGDPNNLDNDVDDLGYAAIAGMIRLPDPTIAKEMRDEGGLSDHEHVFGGPIDDEGFVACVIEGCTTKKQGVKSSRRKATDAEAAS